MPWPASQSFSDDFSSKPAWSEAMAMRSLGMSSMAR
jgi:hypothetical protein